MTLIELAQKIDLDAELLRRLRSFTVQNENKIIDFTTYCVDGFSFLKNSSHMMRLAVCLNYAAIYTLSAYDSRGISRDIFFDTMRDINRWCESDGLKNYRWIKHHLKMELFAIGRLQFQMYECKNKALSYDLLPFEYGDNLIYIHIPAGDKLEFAACVDSIHRAKAFFEKYYPEFEYEFFFSESWLLYEENWAFMASDSNILQFQTLFDIVCCSGDDSQAIERIFGKRKPFAFLYPEKTALQKSAKQYLKKGGKLGKGVGIIHKSEI